MVLEIIQYSGAWLAHLTLDFGSCHDSRVMRLSSVWGLVLGEEPASDSLSPSLSAPPPPCSLSKNPQKLFNTINIILNSFKIQNKICS